MIKVSVYGKEECKDKGGKYHSMMIRLRIGELHYTFTCEKTGKILNPKYEINYRLLCGSKQLYKKTEYQAEPVSLKDRVLSVFVKNKSILSKEQYKLIEKSIPVWKWKKNLKK